MKTVLKVTLGIVLGFTILFVGCAAIIGGAANEVQKDSDKAAITQSDYQSVNTGADGNTRKRLVDRFGEPTSQQDMQSGEIEGIPDSASGTECIYYNRKGELASMYQFCLDTETGRVQSKSAF